MGSEKIALFGYGDVGARITRQLLAHESEQQILCIGRSPEVPNHPQTQVLSIDLDQANIDFSALNKAKLVYLVPPPKTGVQDTRSQGLIAALNQRSIRLQQVILISTTGVYGDCAGEWVTEETPPQPQTDRAKRRLHSEQQWLAWCDANRIPIAVLRVPGIYANSRLPRERLKRGVPVVRAEECGYTNRIHADDLANVVVTLLNRPVKREIINVSDGTPGKISNYLQQAAKVLDLPPLPEISMHEAQSQLSEGMLSYLSESRKISNKKLLEKIKVALRYPDYRVGMRH